MVKQVLKKILIGVTALSIGGATLGATTADARGGAGVAIGAGLLGVAIGASLAHPYYGPPPGAYRGAGYWGYYQGCRSYWRWQPGWHRYVRVHRCY